MRGLHYRKIWPPVFLKTCDFRNRRRVMSATRESSVLSLKQAAAYLQISKAHLSNVINGKVPGVAPVRSFRLGRRVLVRREWIDEWLESGKTAGSE
jgi:excisionase family DNA binding protein